jgi:hypothetical protein
MSDNDRLKSRLTFKSSEFFTFKGTDEHYRATVKLTPSRLIRVSLHDFKACFTTMQAYEIASGLALFSDLSEQNNRRDPVWPSGIYALTREGLERRKLTHALRARAIDDGLALGL